MNTVINNNIIWNNTASEDPQLSYCSQPLYSVIEGWTGGGADIITDNPLLINPGEGNFRLTPDSPCIDTNECYRIIDGSGREFQTH